MYEWRPMIGTFQPPPARSQSSPAPLGAHTHSGCSIARLYTRDPSISRPLLQSRDWIQRWVSQMEYAIL